MVVVRADEGGNWDQGVERLVNGERGCYLTTYESRLKPSNNTKRADDARSIVPRGA